MNKEVYFWTLDAINGTTALALCSPSQLHDENGMQSIFWGQNVPKHTEKPYFFLSAPWSLGPVESLKFPFGRGDFFFFIFFQKKAAGELPHTI